MKAKVHQLLLLFYVQFEALLQPKFPLEQVANINALWAKLIVEECCRLGITVGQLQI
jgi:hypothetical protein